MGIGSSVDRKHFADVAIQRVRGLGHPLCLGLDPYPLRIPPLFQRGSMKLNDPRTVQAVEEFLFAVLDRAEGRAAVVKPQIALFEQLGWRGMRLLDTIIARAYARGLLVLLDAKRGDIGATAEGYARAYLDPKSTSAVDAMTVNPYMGRDAIEPFISLALQHRRGVFVLVRNSNPGAADYQELPTAEGFLYEVVAASLRDFESRLTAPETGWSSLGVTVAATAPEQSVRIRAILPRALFLVLGYGTQGGRACDATRGFVRGPAGLEGGFVNASRTILFPEGGLTDNAVAWEKAFDAGLNAVIDDLTRYLCTETM